MFDFEEKLKVLEDTEKAREIESIVSEISKKFKEIYGEEISDKDVIRLMYYINAYHKSTKYTGNIAIPVLGLTKSGKSTLINSALGCKVSRFKPGEKDIGFESPVTTVGNTLLSSTIYAECHSAPQQSNYCYIDTAGFLDTYSIVSAGISSYLDDKEFITNLSTLSLEICIKNVMRHNPENGMPALIVVVNYSELDGGPNQSLALIKILYSLLGRNEALSDRLVLVVTHADTRRAELNCEYEDAIENDDIELKNHKKEDWVNSYIIGDIINQYKKPLGKRQQSNNFVEGIIVREKGLTVEEMEWFVSLLDKTSKLQQIVIANFRRGTETKRALETTIGRISKKYERGISLDWFNFKSIYGPKEHVSYFSELSEPIIKRSLKFCYDFKQIDSEYNDYATLLDNLEDQIVGNKEYLSSIFEANLNKIKARTDVLQNEKHYLETLTAELDTEEPFEEHVFRELTHYIVLEARHLTDIKRFGPVPGCFLYRDKANKERLALINNKNEIVAQVDLSGLGDKLNSLYWPSLDQYVEVTDGPNRLPQEIRNEVIEKYKKTLSEATKTNGAQKILQEPFREGESIRFYIVYGAHPSGVEKPSIHYSDPGFYIYHTEDGKIMVHVLHSSLPHGISSIFELSSINHENGNDKISLLGFERPNHKVFVLQPLPEFVMDYAVSIWGKNEHDWVYKALLGLNMPPLKEISGQRKNYRPCKSEIFEKKRTRFFGVPSFSFSKHRFDIETNYRTIDDAFITMNDSDTYIPSLHIKSGIAFYLLHRDNPNLLDTNNLYIKKEFLGQTPVYYLGLTLNFDPQCKFLPLTWIPFKNESNLIILNGVTEFNNLGKMDTTKIILDESILNEFTENNFNDLACRIKNLMQRGSKYVAHYETQWREDGYAEVYLYAKRNELPNVIQEIAAKKTRIDVINSEIAALEEKAELWRTYGCHPHGIDKKEIGKIDESWKKISDQLLRIEEQKSLQLQKLSNLDSILNLFAEIYRLSSISPNHGDLINEFIELRKKFMDDNTWYDDTKLFKLLNSAVGKQKSAIYVFPSIPTDPSFSHLKGIVNGYLQGGNGNLVKNKLFIPLNLNGNHWVLITVTLDEREIIYFDPLGNAIPEQLDAALKSNDCFPGFALIDMRLELQKDGYNCGPWVVEFAKKIIAGTDINEKGQFDHIDITAARKQNNETLSRLSSQDSAILLPRIDSAKTNSHNISRLPSTAGTNASNNSHTRAATAGFFSPRREERSHSSSTSSSEDRKDMSLVKK